MSFPSGGDSHKPMCTASRTREQVRRRKAKGGYPKYASPNAWPRYMGRSERDDGAEDVGGKSSLGPDYATAEKFEAIITRTSYQRHSTAVDRRCRAAGERLVHSLSGIHVDVVQPSREGTARMSHSLQRETVRRGLE